jgi:hypothetical protein
MIFGDFGRVPFPETPPELDEWIKVQAGDNPSTKEKPRLSCSSRQPIMEVVEGGPFNPTRTEPLDWFKGKFTGNHGFYHQI